MKRRQAIRVGLAVVAAGGLAGSLSTVLPISATATETAKDQSDTGAKAASGADGPATKLDWGQCPDGTVVVPDAPPLECATVAVPLDYDKPDGRTIDVMISRLASQDPSKRRGVLLLNPGGPGGAGLSLPSDVASLGIPSSVLDSYDLIGFDPRGVGHSAPVSCGFEADQFYRGNIPPYATDAASVAEQAEVAKGVAERCAANDEDGTLRHMSTPNTARDMERIRVALGEQKINYFGLSYGSSLGAAYTAMFPERSDRIILDSNVGNTALDSAGLRRFGLGMELAFGGFATWAAERDSAYELGGTPAEVRKNYVELAERLDEKPIAGVDGATFRLIVFASLYRESMFPVAAQQWQALAASDEAEVRRQLERQPLHERNLPGVGPAPVPDPAANAPELSPYDNAWSSFLAVTCNDSTWPRSVEAYQRNVEIDRKRYPLYGAAGANITPCAFWPYEVEQEPVEMDDKGPSNILVLQNLRDPATPLRGGELLREGFGDRARLVTIDQHGHGAYVFSDNACTTNVATRYLVEGEMPENDTHCAASKGSGLKLDEAQKQQRAETLERLGR